MKERFMNVFGPLCLLCVMGTMIAIPVITIDYFVDRSEIATWQYEELQEWTTEYPELLPMVKEASWEDDVINLGEWSDIKKARRKLANKTILQNMVGE